MRVLPRLLILAGALLAAAGCANQREVSILLPVARLELPEPAPRPFGIASGSATMPSARLTPDQTVIPPDADAPQISRHGETDGQHRLDWQPVAPVMLSLRSFTGDLHGVQAKWVAYAPPREGRGRSLAFTAAHGSGETSFHVTTPGDQSRTRIDQRFFDAAAIFGWRPGPTGLFFGGPYVTRHRYDGDHFNPDGSNEFAGTATLYGMNLGLAWTPVDWFSGLGELSLANVRAGSSRERFAMLSFSLQFHMGRLHEPRSTPAREPPVEVVPAE
jgi:hypothetical protein